MNRPTLQTLADERVKDAEALLAAGRWAAAYYLIGYAVEYGLKACVLRALVDTEIIFGDVDGYKRLKDCWTHDLDKLLGIAGLKDRLNRAIQQDALLDVYWAVAQRWSEVSRYKEKSESEARELFAAITDPAHGVLQWIRTHW